MSTMREISKKLDGNLPQQEAEATGHTCTWGCLQNPTSQCGEFDNKVYSQIKKDAIERARADFARLDPSKKEDAYDFYEACAILLQHRGLYQKPKKHRGYVLGAREFTLTYSPKWMNDAQARVEMEKAMNKLYRYYEGSIVKLRAVGEVGNNGLSHIHCFYKLEGGLKITDKNFQRAWKYWNPKKPLGRGFEGGHHATVKEEADFLGYIEKDIETSWYEKNITLDNNIQNEGQIQASLRSQGQGTSEESDQDSEGRS